jgi:GNAT superfamily N-acetyltransferase
MARPDTLVIRPIGPDDAPEWRRLWRAYLGFYRTELPDEVYAETFARLLSGRDGEFRGLLALVDETPVGLAHFLFHRTCWALADTCYLQDLFADPDHRGRGIGRALIEAVYAAADAEGAASVYWLTQETNTTARRLYDRIGVKTPFIEYHRK